MLVSKIPNRWENYISFDFNRIFINPASGCSAKCCYCYIYDYGHKYRPQIFNISGQKLLHFILSNSKFRKGKNGTLISIGSSCDPFSPEVQAKTLEFLEALIPLGNPIQLSTKYQIDNKILQKISQKQVADGQILIFVTITSFKHWKALEPNASSIDIRLNNFKLSKEQNINTCLYIKPVLHGITENEIDSFADVIRYYKIQLCTVGIIYLGNGILNRLKKLNIIDHNKFDSIYNVRGNRPPPSKTHNTVDSALNIDNLDYICKIISALEKNEAKCTVCSSCAVSLSYDILCPTGVWRYLPHLCVKCSLNCENRYSKASTLQKKIYPLSFNPLTERK